MCGIYGQISATPAKLASRECVRHRGPDDRGELYLPTSLQEYTLSFLHRRLSIIDLTPDGHQPMSNEDGTIWTIFNGEIYNFQALREELRSYGHQFRSRSDTEVLVHGYEQWGEALPKHLDGMFAFGIWDTRRNTLLLARDRIGEKPLFFVLGENYFAFASEIKSILASGLLRAELDPESFHDYLTYLYFPAPRTAYKNIRKLPPAQCMRVEFLGRKIATHIWTYWDLLEAPEDPAARSKKEALPRLRELMSDAVRTRLVSDVPVGITLSGGMDSSTITAFTARAVGSNVKTFSVGFSNPNYDEIPMANLVAEHFKTQHHVIRPDASCSHELTKIIRHFDEPFGNPTAVLELLLTRSMREHVTVALSGEGADEAMGGYPRYIGGRLAHQYRKLPRLLTRDIVAGLASLIRDSNSGDHSPRRIREFAQSAWLPAEEAYLSWIGYFSPAEKAALYTPEFANLVKDCDSGQFLRDQFKRGAQLDPVNRLGYVDVMSFLTFNCLEYADRMSMASSLELRCPFVDHRFVEFAFQMPGAWKIRGIQMKHAMRAAMEGILPEQVINRGKLGFNPPMAEWIDLELRSMIESLLAPEVIARRGLFRPQAVQEVLHAHWEHRRDNGLKIWSLLMIEIWFRMCMDGDSEDEVYASLTAPVAS